MRVDILDLQRSRLPITRLRRVACVVLEAEGLGPDVELSVLLCGEKRMRGLNGRYRRRWRPTDVLSFPQEAAPSVPGLRLLGDVAICIPIAKRQAQAADVSPGREVALLLVHGILHLLGYSDGTAAEARRMEQRQDELLRRAWGK